MALYHKNRIQNPPSTSGQVFCTAWSRDSSAAPVLAVAFGGGGVYLFNEEGLPRGSGGESVLKSGRGEDASVIEWNPSQRLLAIGWKDGALSTWRLPEHRTHEDTVIHKHRIACMLWNGEGTRLVTGDEEGKVGVWKCDSRGRPMPITQLRDSTDARVTHLAFNLAAAPPPEFVDPALPTPCPPFYYSLVFPDRTSIFHGDDRGHKAAAFDVDCEIASMLYYEEKGALVVITRSFTLTVHTFQGGSAGAPGAASWTMVTRVRLSHTAEGSALLRAIWVDKHLLATATDGDAVVRMFDLETDDNFVLSLEGVSPEKRASCSISSIDFCVAGALLAVGSKDGRVYMWRYAGSHRLPKQIQGEALAGPELLWRLLAPVGLPSPVTSICWGPSHRLLSAGTEDAVHMLLRCEIQGTVAGRRGIVQLSPNHVSIENLAGQPSTQVITTSFPVRGACACESHLLLWGGNSAEVYELANSGARKASSFEVPTGTEMAIMPESIFQTNGSSVEVLTIQGTQKQTLLLDDALGHAKHLDVCEELLVVVTANAFIKLWRVSGREAKPHGPSAGRQLRIDGHEFGDIRSVKCNCNGTKVSLLLGSREGGGMKTDSRLVVYDIETDNFHLHDFRSANRRPISHCWDAEEPKLLSCEALLAVEQLQAGGLDPRKEKDLHVTTLFATPEHGVLYHDKVEVDDATEGLLGLQVPYIFLYQKPGTSDAEDEGGKLKGPFLRSVVMCDFAGMESADAKVRKALLGFSYQLSVGNMDEAYKAVKLLRNPRVWESMAVMCIKTKRIDVVEHCLANMGHARAARAAREARKEPELEARLAAVAIQLGLIDDAQKLLLDCERYDLLNGLYQALGDWDRAEELAQKSDRIHVRATHYARAKHLEALGDMRGAIAEYELSENHRYEVPRMLYEWGQLEELEEYIQTKKDKELTRWWARYCEAQGDLPQALSCYESAGDHLALVRIHCFNQRMDVAQDIVDQSGDMAAAFHLARQFEAQEKVPQAIQYFTKAGRFNHAVHLARRYGMDGDVLSLSLKGSPSLMLSSAAYFESKGAFEEAVLLYHKGGKVQRAIEICFDAQLFDALHEISDRLGDNTDPALLTRCGEFFLQHSHFDKAAHLFVVAKSFDRALDLCLEKGVIITEEMAEAMTTKGEQKKSEEAVQMLRRVAKCCQDQGSYHLACKKYTQAGDKVKAMKVLLKSGDTEKIIFFANVSRQREIYVLAANYLQSLDWHSDGEVMKSIIQFYTKAGATDALAAFYEACAQIEIDEYRDYDKALDALREALKQLNRARAEEREGRLASLQRRISMVERFVQARNAVKSDPAEMIRLCNEILVQIPPEQSDLESVVRVGDVFALLVEYHFSRHDLAQAYQFLERMRARNILLSPYLDHQMVEQIYQSMGVKVTDQDGGDDDDHIHEEIADD